MGPNPTGRAPSLPNIQSFNAELERMREAGVLGKSGWRSEALAELAVSERKLALAVGELSNVAAEALTLLESRAVSAWLREVHRDQVTALRERLEAACRSVS